MPIYHDEPHPLAGQTVTLASFEGRQNVEYTVEDWADRVWGDSWGVQKGNPTALKYAARSAFALPHVGSFDEEVLYGKINGFANLIHQSELPSN
jgi:hypothetical protein